MTRVLVNIDELLKPQNGEQPVEDLLALMAVGNRRSTLVVLFNVLLEHQQREGGQFSEEAWRGHECALLILIASTIHETKKVISNSEDLKSHISRADADLLGNMEQDRMCEWLCRYRHKIGSHFDGKHLHTIALRVAENPAWSTITAIFVPTNEPREIRYLFVDTLFFSMLRDVVPIDTDAIGKDFNAFVDDVLDLTKRLLAAIHQVVHSRLNDMRPQIVQEPKDGALSDC